MDAEMKIDDINLEYKSKFTISNIPEIIDTILSKESKVPLCIWG